MERAGCDSRVNRRLSSAIRTASWREEDDEEEKKRIERATRREDEVEGEVEAEDAGEKQQALTKSDAMSLSCEELPVSARPATQTDSNHREDRSHCLFPLMVTEIILLCRVRTTCPLILASRVFFLYVFTSSLLCSCM